MLFNCSKLLNLTWFHFHLEELQASHGTTSRKPNTLWIYGDSVGDFFYKSIIRQPLCKETFKKCNSTYNWVYKIPDRNLTWARLQNDDKDFSIQRVLSEIFEVISQPSMKDNSVLILNLGLHYVHTINFTTYQRLIDKTIRMLTEKFKTNKKSWSFSAKLIWKTTTAIYMEKYGDPRTNARHSTSIRFLTYQVGRNKLKCGIRLPTNLFHKKLRTLNPKPARVYATTNCSLKLHI